MRPTGINGKTAIVTGAARGIGAAVVRALLEEGAKVVGLDTDTDAIAAFEAAHPNGNMRMALVDVADSAAVEREVARTEEEWGPVDLGVNVAGILSTTTVAETTDEEWSRVFAVNAQGVFNLSRALAKRMIPRRRGSIVTVSSNAGGVPRHGMAAYAASKAAATMFTRCLGLELAEHGIRCNVVAPGSTRTEMQTGMWADASGEARVIAGVPELYKAGIPLKRIAEPEDIADAVLFLLSDRARHITMADLYVDGGATLRG